MDFDPLDELTDFVNFAAFSSTIAFAKRSTRQLQPTFSYSLSVTEIEELPCFEVLDY